MADKDKKSTIFNSLIIQACSTYMNTLLKTFILFIFTANVAQAQTMDTTLQNIIDNKLIEQKQSKNFEEVLEKNTPRLNSAYLYALFNYEYKKLTGDNYSQFGSFINFGDEKPSVSEQTKINQELTNYLSKLKSCKLINEKQSNYFQAKINAGDFVHSLQLLPVIIEQVALKERMHPEKLKLFAEKLKNKNLVTTHYEKLLSDIQQEKLQNPIDFLNYCDKAVIINEQDYPVDPANYLELMHQKTASILPELNFSNFEFQVLLDSSISDNDSKFYNFIIALRSNGKKYKQKSSYHLYSPSKNLYYGNKIDQQEYYKIFNKILADLQSPYRLHEVKAYQGNAVEWKTFGIIALTKDQADLLHGGGVFFTPSYESFKNKLTSKKIEQAIEEYKQIGLLSHLSPNEIEKAKEKISEQENTNLNDVLLAFPNVVHMFDTELGNLEDPYAELIREYKKISHNEFKASEISDDFDIEKKKKVKVKFNIADKPYSSTFKLEGDWIDPQFFIFIKSVVVEQNLKGQFYDLYTGGQEASIIYLTKEQYEYIGTKKLLVFADEWQTEEE